MFSVQNIPPISRCWKEKKMIHHAFGSHVEPGETAGVGKTEKTHIFSHCCFVIRCFICWYFFCFFSYIFLLFRTVKLRVRVHVRTRNHQQAKRIGTSWRKRTNEIKKKNMANNKHQIYIIICGGQFNELATWSIRPVHFSQSKQFNIPPIHS